MLFEEMMAVYAEHNMKPTQYKAVFLKLWSAAGFGRKIVAKNVSDTERMKNTPMSAMKLPLLVDLQQKVGE
jgi:hypothetical protein